MLYCIIRSIIRTNKETMNIVILSKSTYIYSTEALFNELNKHNFTVQVINPLECDVTIEKNIYSVIYKKEIIDNIQYVIPRIGAASDFYGIHILQAFEKNGIKTLNTAQSILNTRNKFYIYENLQENNLPTAKTILIKSSHNLDYWVKHLNGFPVILKLTRGSQGQGIMIAESYNTLKAIIDTMTLLEEDIILQEYIETDPKYSDIRVYILNNEVIGATQRINKDDFRSNTHCGGIMTPFKINDSLKELALKTAQCFNLNFCSIDFLNSLKGPIILEVNSTPGLEKAEQQALLPLSTIIVNYIEQQLCQKTLNI